LLGLMMTWSSDADDGATKSVLPVASCRRRVILVTMLLSCARNGTARLCREGRNHCCQGAAIDYRGAAADRRGAAADCQGAAADGQGVATDCRPLR
jgi:hypothetical protein